MAVMAAQIGLNQMLANNGRLGRRTAPNRDDAVCKRKQLIVPRQGGRRVLMRWVEPFAKPIAATFLKLAALLQSKAVILRESGVSSTPQLFDLMANALEYWITRRSLSSGSLKARPGGW